ncbi:MAG: hypothetical protein ABSA59_03555 [Terriglobia bacterium]|jgi:hypothetical protein
MPEIKTYTLNLPEIAEILIKKLDIHEGLWGVYLEFGIGTGHVPGSPEGKTIAPAVIGVVQKIGIQRFDSPNNLTVDAAKVNPPSRKSAKKQKASSALPK